MKKGAPIMKQQDTLDDYRDETAQIDNEIVSLLSRRLALAAEVGRIKWDRGMDALDEAGERKLLQNLISRDHNDFTSGVIRTVFSEIISASRAVQQAMKVAYLGPEATFSHQAAVSLYGSSALFRPAESIEEVFGLVEKNECHRGIVPIENSYEGFINRSIDLFYEYSSKILSESYSKIEHHLFSLAEDSREVKKIYSHPMAHSQCRLWVSANLPGVTFSQAASTAYGARRAAEEPDAAAICCNLAGETYGLRRLYKNIEDVPGNYTRFFVIGKDTVSRPTGDDKTSLLFLVSHTPGTLYRTLGAIAKRGINLNHIHSRPLKSRSWEYLFIVDLTGHEKDPPVADALKEMEEYCVFLKVIGSYPAGSQSWRLPNQK